MTLASLLISLPGGHIAGIPIEEMLASFGPVLLLVVGGALAILRARLGRVRHAAKTIGRATD
jgi:hypothetical protein